MIEQHNRWERNFFWGTVAGLIIVFLFLRALYGAPAPSKHTLRDLGSVVSPTLSSCAGYYTGKFAGTTFTFTLCSDGSYTSLWPPNSTWWSGTWRLHVCGGRVYAEVREWQGLSSDQHTAACHWYIPLFLKDGKAAGKAGDTIGALPVEGK